jgi:hypothetical protein
MIVNEEAANSAVEAFEPIKDEILGSTEKNEEPTEFVEQTNTDTEMGTRGSFAEENNEVQVPIPPLPDLSQQPAETELSFQPYHTCRLFRIAGNQICS